MYCRRPATLGCRGALAADGEDFTGIATIILEDRVELVDASCPGRIAGLSINPEDAG